MAKIFAPKNRLKETDEFISLSRRLVDFFTENYKLLLAGVLILALATGGWTLYKNRQQQRLEAAAAEVAKLQAELARLEGAAGTLEALDKILAASPAGGPYIQAAAFKAHLLYQDKKYGEAAKVYESLRGRDPGLDMLLADNLSYCYEAEKQFGKAAEVLTATVEQAKPPFQTELLRRQAALYELAGDSAKAREKYQQLMTLNPPAGLAAYFSQKMEKLPAP